MQRSERLRAGDLNSLQGARPTLNSVHGPRADLNSAQGAGSDLNGNKSSPEPPADPVGKASLYFRTALAAAGLKPEYVAVHLSAQGFRVSPVLVSYWQNPTRSELPNGAHLVALGPEFERVYSRVVRKANGWGRLAILGLLDAAGDVAEMFEP
jgi:hypothetical protein